MAAPPKPILSSLTPAQFEHALGMLSQFADRSGGPDACHPWTGGSFVGGYGVFYTLGTTSTRRMIKAHRLVFELANDGACPPVVDHICHDNAECDLGERCPHRRCCNQRHLNASTIADNLSRALSGIYQETCIGGHPMSGDNVYVAPSGARACRLCAAASARAARRMAAPRRKLIASRPRPRGQSRQEAVEWALDGQDPDACMYWPGVTPGRAGYVTVGVEGRQVPAHRLVYTVRTGAIPAGHVVDHACHKPAECAGGMDCPHRPCINPAHLAAVTNAVNVSRSRASHARSSACGKGHEFTKATTFVDKFGVRHCLTCQADRQRADRAAVKAEPGWVDGRFRVGDMCPNGHDVTVTGLDAKGKCAECSRARHKEYKAEQRAAAKAEPGRANGSMRRDGICRNGHDVTVTGLTKRGRCKECKRLADLASVARRTSDTESRRSGVCRNGHDLTVVGLDAQGCCAECARAWRLDYSAGRWAAMKDEPGPYRRAASAA